MNRRIGKAKLYGGVTALAAAWASPAMAQPADAQPADQPAEAQRPAREDAGAAQNDIVVTARRTEERLQDVPISIQVFNQNQISDRNITTGTDLANYTPSLSINPRFGSENSTFSLRGFTAESRTQASVGVYFADVVAPRGGTSSISTGDGAGPGYFFDLANVQVLKGPQGTLFGRNTTGGAVLFVPRRPTADFEGYLEGSYGNYDMQRLQGVVNIPLTDNARFRIGGDWQRRDGWLNNVNAPLTGGPADLADINYYALRASLLVDLTPDLENYTIVSFSESDTNGVAGQLQRCNPAATFGLYACPALARVQAGGDLAVASSLSNPRSFLRQWQVINTTTWRINDNLTLKNIASYSQILNRTNLDFFGATFILPATIPNPLNPAGPRLNTGALAGTRFQFNNVVPGENGDGTFANQENFTEELQLQGTSFAGRLRWQIGGYIERSRPLGFNSNNSASNLSCSNRFALQCIDPIAAVWRTAGGPLAAVNVGSLTVQRFRAEYDSTGIYGQGTFDLTDNLHLTAGIRYTWDTTETFAQNLRYQNFSNGTTTPIGTCANVTIRPQSQPFTDPNQCNINERQESEAPTWVIGLEYNPVEDVLLYGKWSRGYRQGSVNPLGSAGFTIYGPESVNTYEVGAKTNWRGALPGFFNISGFYNDFTNQQLQVGLFTPPPPAPQAPPNQAIINVGASRIWGIEVEAGITPLPGLTFTGSYTYINAELTEVTPPVLEGTLYSRAEAPVVGGTLGYTPENKATINATYTFPFPETVGEVSFGWTYSFIDEQLNSYSAFGTTPSYQLLNFNFNWRGIAGSPVDLALFMTNATDERYIISTNDQTTTGFFSGILGEPRMYGIRLRYNFGPRS